MVGVHTVASGGWRLIDSALKAAGKDPVVRTFLPAQGRAVIPDATSSSQRSLVRTFKVSQSPSTTLHVELDLDIACIDPEDRRDLYITLRSPGGRTTIVYDGLFDTENPDYHQPPFPYDDEPMSYFYGINPNGTWTLTMWDEVRNSVTSEFVSAELKVKAR